MEPRFKKALEDWKKREELIGEELRDKKTKYLRLGYKSEPRKRKIKKVKKESSECPGGNQNCKSCKTANIISPEALLRGLPENPCKGSSCDACNECD